jgi:FAD:protein FMN transferase
MNYLLVLIWLNSWWPAVHEPERLFRISGRAQGTTYSISYMHADSIVSIKEIDSIFRAIDLSLSLYEPKSLINQFNKKGEVRMDEHMQSVVIKSLLAWKESGGCFDITVKSLVDLWGFGVQGRDKIPGLKEEGQNITWKIPSRAAIRRALKITGSQWLRIMNDTLMATKKNVQINCNGIAQGYSVDVVFRYLEEKGLKDLIVEIGGEIRAGGKNADGVFWRIGVESPSGITENWHPVDQIIDLDNRSVTTSGSYRKYFIQKGRQYTHIIDPLKGRPVDNGIISVTVVAPDAITADAWDNGFFVMGIDSAFATVKQHPELELRIIYSDSSGNIRDSATAGIKSALR